MMPWIRLISFCNKNATTLQRTSSLIGFEYFAEAILNGVGIFVV